MGAAGLTIQQQMQALKIDRSIIEFLLGIGNAAPSIHKSPSEFSNPTCPWLPELSALLDASVTRHHSAVKGPEFYEAALRYAHSHWLGGKPAQAMLQLTKAWMADLGEAPVILGELPPPYCALVWIMEMAAAGERGFLGNPVRHFQHLASRMSGPRSEARSWRAWVCFHLAEKVLPPGDFPRDGVQIVREGLWIPSWQHSLSRLGKYGWPGEAACASAASMSHKVAMEAWRMEMAH
jgi:hypothetical protein